MAAELTSVAPSAPSALSAPSAPTTTVGPVQRARVSGQGRGRRQSPVLRIRSELPMRWRIGLAVAGLAVVVAVLLFVRSRTREIQAGISTQEGAIPMPATVRLARFEPVKELVIPKKEQDVSV